MSESITQQMMFCCWLQMDTMANQAPSHQVRVSEGSAKEESGLSAAFRQERCVAESAYTLVFDKILQIIQIDLAKVWVNGNEMS